MLNKTIVKNWINLISYPYYMAPNVTKLEVFSSTDKRKTKVINIYDNKIGKGQRWQRLNPRKKRILKNIDWQFITKH